MIREKLIIGLNIYNCEYNNNSKDIDSNTIYKKYVFVRNFEMYNNVIIDKDIYIIEKDIYDDICEGKQDIITFPMTNNVLSYSKNPILFNSLYTDTSFIHKFNNLSIGDDVYLLYDKDGNEIDILCDTIKIYHPLTSSEDKLIFHVHNLINGINFHYLSRLCKSYETKSENEYKIGNLTYSEYIELTIPNISDLFKLIDDTTYKVYFNEDLNNIISEKNETFLHSRTKSIDDSTLLVPLNLLIQPYRIVQEKSQENTDIFVKQYLKLHKTIENNYLNFPISFTVYPYESYNKDIELYTLQDELKSSTIVFFEKNKFKILSNLGFCNGKLSCITKFNYPNKQYFLDKNNNDTNKALVEAYKYYYDVNEEKYEEYSKTYNEIKNTDEHVDISDLTETFLDKVEILEFEEETLVPVDFLGYTIKLSTDLGLKNVIYYNFRKSKLEQLDDFAFALNGIFNSWNELNEQIIITIDFVDNYLGLKINSNFVVVTKEWFKYMINDSINKITELIEKNKEIDMKNLNLSEGVNFVNNINCVIVKENKENSNVINRSSSTRAIYKPIFYKTNELQNISIRYKLILNIGINLSEYMTKVETFKINIDNNEYFEIGRNDIYVLFRVDAGKIVNISGQYDIFTDTDDYISTGFYNIY